MRHSYKYSYDQSCPHHQWWWLTPVLSSLTNLFLTTMIQHSSPLLLCHSGMKFLMTFFSTFILLPPWPQTSPTLTLLLCPNPQPSSTTMINLLRKMKQHPPQTYYNNGITIIKYLFSLFTYLVSFLSALPITIKHMLMMTMTIKTNVWPASQPTCMQNPTKPPSSTPVMAMILLLIKQNLLNLTKLANKCCTHGR